MPSEDADGGRGDRAGRDEADTFADLRDDGPDPLFDELEARQRARETTRTGADDPATAADADDDEEAEYVFAPSDDDELLDRWADEGQFESAEPRRNWSNLVAVLVIAGLVASALLVGWALLSRAARSDEAAPAGAGGDARAPSVLDEDPPSLDDLTSAVTLPPGPSDGLHVAESGVTVVEDRFDPTAREGTFAVIIDNPHPDWLAQGVQVSVTFQGADGSALGSDDGFIEVVLPGQRVAVSSLFFDAPTEPVTGLDVAIDVARWRPTQPFDGSFELTDVETSEAEYSGVVTDFQITSHFAEPLTDVGVTAVYRDAAGRIIGGYDTFVDLLEPEVPTPAKVALLANIDIDDVASTELYPVATFGFVPGEGG